MANPIFVGMDLSLLTITASNTEDAAFPLANLKTYFARDQWRSSSLADNQWLKFDLGSAKAIDSVVVQNFGNIADTGMTTLQYDSADSSSFSSPVTATTFGETPDPQYLAFSSATKRYWRIIFGTTADYPRLGNFFLAKRLDFGAPYSNPFEGGNPSHETAEAIALDGSLRTSTSYLGRKRWLLNFLAGNALTDATLAEFRTFFALVGGKLLPFYFLDTDGTTLKYVHFDTDKDPSVTIGYNKNEIRQLTLKEQLTS